MSKYLKKISLKNVENKLGLSLRKNIISVGFDVAGHSTGIALIKTTDTYLILVRTHKFVIPKKIQELDAIDLFLEQLDTFKNEISRQYKLDETIIENCFMKFNVITLKMLARCGILVYDRFRGISKRSQLIMPLQARSKVNFKKSDKKVKGTKLKKEIIAYINNLLEIELEDNDIADSIILALVGVIK